MELTSGSSNVWRDPPHGANGITVAGKEGQIIIYHKLESIILPRIASTAATAAAAAAATCRATLRHDEAVPPRRSICVTTRYQARWYQIIPSGISIRWQPELLTCSIVSCDLDWVGLRVEQLGKSSDILALKRFKRKTVQTFILLSSVLCAWIDGIAAFFPFAASVSSAIRETQGPEQIRAQAQSDVCFQLLWSSGRGEQRGKESGS
ncbi:hypothetical protein Mapa_010772 [Marchantia paleacea]|nr:hypothetical protein Mapa_010772 [Marchantia paleacea]